MFGISPLGGITVPHLQYSSAYEHKTLLKTNSRRFQKISRTCLDGVLNSSAAILNYGFNLLPFSKYYVHYTNLLRTACINITVKL